MSFRVTIRRVVDVTVLEMAGSISLGEGATTLRQSIRDAVWEGHKKVVLVYEQVRYQDSSGIGELVSGFTIVSNSGGELVLAGIQGKPKDLLQITKLYTVFQSFLTLDDALVYFDSKPKDGVDVSTRVYGVGAVLEVSGVLSAEQAGKISARIDNFLKEGIVKVVILWPQVLGIDDEAARVILQSADRLRASGGDLVLAGIEPRLEPLIPIQELTARLQHVRYLVEALSALSVELPPDYRWAQVGRV
jgi:anti-sigma B factor antagonist